MARPAPFGDALEIGAGTGYFSLNLLQAGAIERATATDISPGMLATLEENAARLGPRGADGGGRGGDAALRRRELRPRLRARGPPSHPRPRAGVLGVRAGAAAGRDARLLRGALALRRLPGGDPEADGAADGAALAAAGAAPRAPRLPEAEHNGHALEPEVDVHAFSPGDLRRFCAGRGPDRGQGPRRGAARLDPRLDRADPGGERGARRGAVGMAALRVPQLSGAAAGGQPGPGAAPAPAALLQPAGRRAQAAAPSRGRRALPRPCGRPRESPRDARPGSDRR